MALSKRRRLLNEQRNQRKELWIELSNIGLNKSGGDSGSAYRGSNPCLPAIIYKRLLSSFLFVH
jgi:hypothetical protein